MSDSDSPTAIEIDPAAENPEAYRALASVGPYAVGLGSALITMVEPVPGYEIAYNRWYEDDHIYAGGTAMPWLFSAKRWVAPSALRALRYPDPSPVASPLSDGRYITLYWTSIGREAEHVAWSSTINTRLHADGRGFPHRKHIYTAWSDYLGVVYRDVEGPRDFHALDYPWGAMVLQVLDATSQEQFADLVSWLTTEHLPTIQARSGINQSLMFQPQPMDSPFVQLESAPEPGRRLTLIHFVEDHPLAQWEQRFGGHGDAVAASGLGTISFCSPFVPTLPGTNVHALD